MILSYFSSTGWQDWDVEHRPTIPEGMALLIDDDLLLEDGPVAPRPAVVVNRWLCQLPASGVSAAGSWESYARAVKQWMEFLAEHGVVLFDSRERLKAVLGRYAEHRGAGPLEARFAATTWARHMSILSVFYRWAIQEGHTDVEPFTYRMATTMFTGAARPARVNLAVRRLPKPHVTIKYLEPDFIELFRSGLRGLAPDGTPDTGFAGRELARNSAIGDLALATGLRLTEFTYLLPWEVPSLPAAPSPVPILFPVPSAITKGRKFRTTWISYEALAGLHDYLHLDRAAAAEGSSWRPPRRWGPPLLVTAPDARGGRINGVRRPWELVTPAERRRLVAPDGGSCLLSVKAGGGPFTAWATVFERTADRIRERFEPRFPHVHPHRLRHSFAMGTLEILVTGYYRRAAKLVREADADAALLYYLTKADPLLVLRDLLGHSSVLTTEKYTRRLDTTRIYRQVYESVGAAAGLLDAAAADREVAEEFDESEPGEWL